MPKGVSKQRCHEAESAKINIPAYAGGSAAPSTAHLAGFFNGRFYHLRNYCCHHAHERPDDEVLAGQTLID